MYGIFLDMRSPEGMSRRGFAQFTSAIAALLSLAGAVGPWEKTSYDDAGSYIAPSGYILGWCAAIILINLLLLNDKPDSLSVGRKLVIAALALWLFGWYALLGMPVPAREHYPYSDQKFWSWFLLLRLRFDSGLIDNVSAFASVNIIAMWLTALSLCLRSRPGQYIQTIREKLGTT